MGDAIGTNEILSIINTGLSENATLQTLDVTGYIGEMRWRR